MKVSVIITILNEEENIKIFLDSLLIQTSQPYEVIIVDGGSKDKTLKVIDRFKKDHKMSFSLLILSKKGNRSIGRNEGVRRAKSDIIAFTDVGCILDKNWVKEIQKPFMEVEVDVVAGNYREDAKTIFQMCLVPYVLVMPDKIDPNNFLPATRSMAIRKRIFIKMGGFDVRYSHNEDYVFARKLKLQKKKIVFARAAIVYWIPRNNFTEAFTMFKRFACGDMEAGILRKKVIFLFLRYLFGLCLILAMIFTSKYYLTWLVISLLIFYLFWSVYKNFKYIKKIQAFYLLPLIQLTADIAVMIGSLEGFLKKWDIQKMS